MSVSIDWDDKIISVPKVYMTVVQTDPYEVRELDLNEFHKTLRDLEYSEAGIPFLHTHTHTAPVAIGGVSLARVVEIINGYTITFEDGQYAVSLVGANTNLVDTLNLNQVSVRSANSAGLIMAEGGGGGVTEQDKLDIADRVWDELLTTHTDTNTAGEHLQRANTQLLRAMGLMHRNYRLSNPIYVGNLMQSADITTYTDNTLTTILESYTITITHNGNLVASHQMVNND